MVMSSSIGFNRGKRVIGIQMASTGAILELGHRIQHRRRRLRLLVRSGLELLRMAPGTIRLVGGTPLVWRTGNHLVIADMA